MDVAILGLGTCWLCPVLTVCGGQVWGWAQEHSPGWLARVPAHTLAFPWPSVGAGLCSLEAGPAGHSPPHSE